MRRALVLTTEFARHPFRATLPQHVYLLEDSGKEDAAERKSWDDLRGFLQAYVACLVGVTAFIA